jgi:hypothetical protein
LASEGTALKSEVARSLPGSLAIEGERAVTARALADGFLGEVELGARLLVALLQRSQAAGKRI